jgi:GNAT superfamily N-acetyltransferase
MLLRHIFEDTVKRSEYTSRSGDPVVRLTLDGGYLDYSEDDGVYWLQMVEVEPSKRNKGVATSLVKAFLDIVNTNSGYLDATEYLDDGEKYLKHVIDRLKPNYPKIEWAD